MPQKILVIGGTGRTKGRPHSLERNRGARPGDGGQFGYPADTPYQPRRTMVVPNVEASA